MIESGQAGNGPARAGAGGTQEPEHRTQVNANAQHPLSLGGGVLWYPWRNFWGYYLSAVGWYPEAPGEHPPLDSTVRRGGYLSRHLTMHFLKDSLRVRYRKFLRICHRIP